MINLAAKTVHVEKNNRKIREKIGRLWRAIIMEKYIIYMGRNDKLNLQRSSCFSCTAFHSSCLFCLHFSSTNTTFTHTHSPGDVPLCNNANTKRQSFLYPLCNPFTRVNGVALNDFRNRFWNGGTDNTVGVVVWIMWGDGGIKPVNPLLWNGLCNGMESNAVDRVVKINCEENLFFKIIFYIHDILSYFLFVSAGA
ncbi:hypothetical protein I7I53_04944 [Histoplasma capsulatum var. duboisii H88]|uniref:Uncharacterized protein n=1 Tax=Ajellomyces capsulatus (strain H88) TaxID=544711 RepID=A0A8A1LRJ9_AJEC8|nr:hypothetical protein I7I53_04944 [Histoplasma capsulatum var. duboisii H88]